VGGRGEHCLASTSLHGGHDALVVCGHDDGIDQASLAGALIDVLDHWLPGNRDQRLARETRGSIA
jgi:hypothetical protein